MNTTTATEILTGTARLGGTDYGYRFENEVWDHRTYCHYIITNLATGAECLGTFLTHRRGTAIEATIAQQVKLGRV